MDNRRIWLRLGGVLAAAAVCTGGAAVVSDRAQEAKNVQTAFLGAMETQMQARIFGGAAGQSGYHHCDHEEGEQRMETGLD